MLRLLFEILLKLKDGTQICSYMKAMLVMSKVLSLLLRAVML